MEMKEYISFVNEKMEKAQAEGDKTEWVRLARLLIETLQDKITETCLTCLFKEE